MSNTKNRKSVDLDKRVWMTPWATVARSRCRDMINLTAKMTEQVGNVNYAVWMIQDAVKDMQKAVKSGDRGALRLAESRFDRRYRQYVKKLNTVKASWAVITEYTF